MGTPRIAPPASGAWQEGDPVGDRRFADLGPIDLELGGHLEHVRVAYETWGELDADRSNAVLVLHALTGDSHVSGDAGPGHPTPGWWDGLIGPGAAIDTDRWYVVAPNVLGGCQGTTGPSSIAADGKRWGSRFPRITVGDQVAVEVLLADHLGVGRWATVVGGSMGGMRALEWLVAQPERVDSGLVLAVGAIASADQIATQTTQTLAITSDPGWRGGDYHSAPDGEGPTSGLGIARRIAHLTYRSEGELEARFGADVQPGEDPLRDGRYAVQSYLDHHADKLASRFDAGSYVALTDAMTTWDLGRGRGGVDAALATITTPVVVGGIDTDRLYPLHQQDRIARRAPGAVGGLRIIGSPYGHDGFLVEREAVFALVAEALELSRERCTAPGP
ncbi:MAG TPA: homoserine O-acetyltransferase [Candidatus Nanopelagicales bacterium]|nr:homoserine O-acetyltransferase [Candidatus Nanopelagicales bacterium]